MSDAARVDRMAFDQDQRIADVVARETSRLRRFIRRRVRDARDVDDVVQDVFAALVEANRLLTPIEHVTGWLYRVARNRITDLFRRKWPEPLEAAVGPSGEDEAGALDDLLPSTEAGPDEELTRHLLLTALDVALDDLPAEQREVFVAHEIEGRSFKELAEATGVSINTLLSRKRYAVRHLRAHLQQVYDDITQG